MEVKFYFFTRLFLLGTNLTKFMKCANFFLNGEKFDSIFQIIWVH